MSRRISRHLSSDILDSCELMSCEIELTVPTKAEANERNIFYHDDFDNYTGRIFNVARLLRANFLTPNHWSCGKILNGVVASAFTIGAIYSLGFTFKASLEEIHTPYEMASNLTNIAWGAQAIVSMVFLVYWQLYGHLRSYHRHIVNCQHGAGIAHGKTLIKSNIRWFYSVLALEIVVIFLFEIKFYTETLHTEIVEKRARMFYYKALRPLNTVITLYTFIIWHVSLFLFHECACFMNVSMFLYITYTNTAFLEVRYFNSQMEELDGSMDDIEKELLKKIEVYGRLAGVIRELDRIFRLYAFIMVVIIVPSITFTLMMLNQRIHSWQDLVLCLPGVALCAYSFLGVTVAPARLHDEVNRSKSCLLQNASIWFPYRKDVYQIATTLCQHMEQYDLGISIWGFAIVSRPLILATFSVMTMVLSLLIELSPSASLVHQHNHSHVYANVK